MVITLFANISQLANAADRLYLGLGQIIFWTLLLLFMVLLFVPMILFFTLPKPLIPPKDPNGNSQAEFMSRLRENLKKNPMLSGMAISTDEDVAIAIEKLSGEANKLIKNTASTVFVSTAVMQNGRIDGLIVLGTQLRMVWRISTIYYQRPSLRQLLYLYGHVAANVLVAENVQEIEFSEIATPIMAAIFPSLKGAIPGLQGISTLLVNSLASGAANSFMTLRVGIIARCYCEAVSAPTQTQIRQSATAGALALVREISREQGEQIAKNAWDAVRSTAGTAVDVTIQGTKDAIDKATTTTVDGIRSAGGAINNSWDKLKEAMTDTLPTKNNSEPN